MQEGVDKMARDTRREAERGRGRTTGHGRRAVAGVRAETVPGEPEGHWPSRIVPDHCHVRVRIFVRLGPPVSSPAKRQDRCPELCGLKSHFPYPRDHSIDTRFEAARRRGSIPASRFPPTVAPTRPAVEHGGRISQVHAMLAREG